MWYSRVCRVPSVVPDDAPRVHGWRDGPQCAMLPLGLGMKTNDDRGIPGVGATSGRSLGIKWFRPVAMAGGTFAREDAIKLPEIGVELPVDDLYRGVEPEKPDAPSG